MEKTKDSLGIAELLAQLEEMDAANGDGMSLNRRGELIERLGTLCCGCGTEVASTMARYLPELDRIEARTLALRQRVALEREGFALALQGLETQSRQLRSFALSDASDCQILNRLA